MDMARCGESLSRAATQGVEKGVWCLFFARNGSFAVVAGGGVEIFSFKTGDIGIVHLDELEVSKEGAYVGESVDVSRVESNVSKFVSSCEHFKKNACVTDRGERRFTGSFKNPHRVSWR
jgi:hypothetical protein